MNYNFSREDVDAVLYGYIGDRCDRQKTSHSLSGLCTNPADGKYSIFNPFSPRTQLCRVISPELSDFWKSRSYHLYHWKENEILKKTGWFWSALPPLPTSC